MVGLTVSRLDFGNFMQGLRMSAPKTSMISAALRIDSTRQVLDRLERGGPTKLGRLHINGLLDYYEATPEQRSEALRLWEEIREQDKAARAQGNSKGFWKAYSDQVAPNFEKFLRLEGAAEAVTAFQPVIVPGLLQTPEYRRAIIRIDHPDLSAVDTERLLELTERRQTRLSETGFRLEAFISEAVLRNHPCDPETMLEQLRHLTEIGERENVSIRVIPFSVGPHKGLTIQVFTLLRLPKGASGMVLPPLVYAEGAVGSVFHEHGDEVSQYEQAIDGLRAVALSEEDTRDLVLRAAKEYSA
ncbi:XRE family transcriptional regulator [Nocardia uniformis]|uniref:XRE family transcriptional regulator n=1 Tax=Nocardia uniformis TaxID=53432 RepID=A0A849C1M6_9NOCA|nr:DUF5753 domain-containing protein [Nocardia uniformis]NNH71396.1 XRE family transcriptional regulator [Nocardia uniformis]